MAFVVRYSDNQRGAITFTGNTLGLSRSDTVGVPGTLDSIGAFTTVDTSLRFGTYPFGTTSNYTLNSAAAVLVIPSGSTVLYAELIWGGTYVNGNVNLTANINNPVTLRTPAGTSFSIQPDNATAQSVTMATGILGYVRSANVTSIITSAGAGTYTVGNVVGTIVVPDDTSNHAGWTLAVVYLNPTLPFRNMSLRVGSLYISAGGSAVSTSITGFATPTSGTVSGRALFSAQEGDANRTGDQARFGPNTSNLTILSGPNNFANNFFASQINKDDGTLDTSGTFGTRNATNGAPGTNISGGRQGWDITNVDVSSTLSNNQTSAVLQLTSSGDAYLVNANALQININSPQVNVTKSTSSTFAVVGDNITYTVVITNTGSLNATNAVFTDIIPAGTTLVANSVRLNGTVLSNPNLSTGISLGTLAPGSTNTIQFTIRVASVPTGFQENNQAVVSYSFQSISGGSTVSGSSVSNVSSVPVLAPVINLVKTGSSTAATVGDTITYNIAVQNTGSISANVTVTDPIPNGSVFVPNSVRVGGVPVPGGNPVSGINSGNVPPNGTVNVSFDVNVTQVPTPQQLTNQASAAFTFQPPDGRTINGSSQSNTLSIPVSSPNVNVVKSTNVTEAVVGDVVTFVVNVTDSGISAVTNAVLIDPVPASGSFVAGSVTIAGVPQPLANPNTGIAIGTIAAGQTIPVTFQFRVDALPSAPSNWNNQATVSFTSGTFSGTSTSNLLVLPIYNSTVAAEKSVNQTVAQVGNTLTYTVQLSNTGNVASTVVLTDNIPTGTVFVPNSVTVNGVTQTGASPTVGIPVGSIAAGASSTVTFQVNVVSVPPSQQLNNQASISYTFQTPSGRTTTRTANSNTVSIPVSAPNVSIVKQTSRTVATIGDIILYTVNVRNQGVDNVTNAVLTDTFASGSTFVPNSVTVNGVSRPGTDPSSGLAIGTITPGQTVPVTFQVSVDSIPQPSGTLLNQSTVLFTAGTFTGTSTSNTVSIAVFQPIISAAKQGSESRATVGDTITYTITIQNTGNYAATATVTDTIPAGTAFIPNSVAVNGVPKPGSTPGTGILVGIIDPGGTATVTFQVNVASLPTPQILSNQATVSYSYLLPDGRTLTGSIQSNTSTIPVSSPNVGVALTANLPDVTVGDIITYTINTTNSGVANIDAVIASDQLAVGASFIPGSVVINGVPAPAEDPRTGIPIGVISPGQSIPVTFQVRVDTLPPTAVLTTQAIVSYTSGTFSGTSASNALTIPVYEPIITAAKSADHTRATVGDTITYSFAIANSGNYAASAILTDTIPVGTTFVPNTVIISGVAQPDANPATGIALGTITAGETITVTFQVNVTSLPSPQTLNNQATIGYNYQLPSGRAINKSIVSNPLSIPVSAPNISIVKSANVVEATINDVLTYSLAITNDGFENVTNAIVSDTIAAGSAFVPGSVIVGGASRPTANPGNGINVGTIVPGQTLNVTFQVQVTSLPAPPFLTNTASVSFTSGTFTGSSVSNTSSVPIYDAVIQATKSANSSNATVGDTITYTISVSNSGDVPADTIVTDQIPEGTTFVPNTVTINSVPIAGANIAAGVNIGSVAPSTTVVLTFQLNVVSLPVTQTIINSAVIDYSFALPSGRIVSRSLTTNIVTIPVSSPDVTVTKISNVTAVVVGDEVVYSFTVRNNGIQNVTNAILVDPIAPGSSFVTDSVLVDGFPRLGENPTTGITLGTIVPNQTVTISFSANVTALPPSQVLVDQATVSYTSGTFTGSSWSNSISIAVFQPILTATKQASQTVATVGDIITYSIVVTNTGNINVIGTLIDNVPPGAVLLANSVIVNGEPRPGFNPATGIPLGTIEAGGSASVSFKINVTTLPSPQELVNQATVGYSYIAPDGRTLTGTVTSNPVTIPVSSPNLTLSKQSNYTSVGIGDTIVYSISLNNSGVAPVTDVTLTDSIPDGASFVPNSVTINGIPIPTADPQTGITIGTIAPSATVLVTFQANVVTVPLPPTLVNQATASFTSGTFTGTSTSNTVVIAVFQPALTLAKSSELTNASIGDTFTYTIQVSNTGNIAANITITDPIPNGAVFVPNSVLVGGTPLPSADPQVGFSIGSLAANASVPVTFQVNVVSQPVPPVLSNQATAAFTFTLPDARTLNGSASSNIVNVPVSVPDVSLTQTANQTSVSVADIITYNITATNNGIQGLTAVVITEPIPAGTSFVPGSVTINGTPVPGADPSAGIPIGTLNSGQSVIVSYQLLVNSVPSPPNVTTQPTITFTRGTFTGSTVADPLSIPVFEATLAAAKSANHAAASVGDTVTYTVVVTNTGNITASAVVTDPLPANVVFIQNSVTVNGVPVAGANPTLGIPITSDPNVNVTVTFQVNVVSLPDGGSMSNQASVPYSFQLPDGRTKSGNIVSNTVTIPVFLPDLDVVKGTTTTEAAIGDTITYSVLLTNTSIEPVTNVIVNDPLPNGASFVAGSVTVNGTSIPAANPATGVFVGVIEVSATATVTYQLSVVALPPTQSIDNTASASFSLGSYSATVPSNPVSVPVYEARIAALKSASRSVATVGDTVQYTIVVSNTGNTAATAVFTDATPVGSVFIPGSVTINGAAQPSANPNTGFAIGTIGASGSVTVAFQINIVSLPPSQQLLNQADVDYTYALPSGRTISGLIQSNTVAIPVSSPDVTIAKSANATVAVFNDVVTYTITVTNNGIETVSNAVVFDPIPAGSVFIPGSVTVNNVSVPDGQPNSGIDLHTIAPGQTETVRFQVRVVSLPNPPALSNQATVSFTSGTFTGTSVSNMVTVAVIQAIITVTKTISQSEATVGDTVTYTLVASNDGNIGASTVLTDPIAEGGTFVPGSVTINGVPSPASNPQTGVTLSNIAPGTSTTVTFQVEVTSLPPSTG
ncbi:DUF11 domain-containing protein [Paenibacillus arenosi]|uniref:DUF11 domain-containing protein n=1 Tax=Paenibacillus arenosi TaxID=2774142 RepID=A0ABR9AX87_9BACL|nr:DUF11 domain-containing protein [Paenibacillus arenosi]MBD8497571.1 DUF11 domain-containing protein [Paenibacillus arenosi]